MQSGYLLITIVTQFFFVAGCLFYLLFRKWSAIDDQVVLMSWVTCLLGVLTLGLIGSLALILPRLVFTEAIIVSVIALSDIAVLYLLVRDIWRRKMTIEHGFIDEET